MSKSLPINTVICGDALKIMQIFPDESIDMCLTSPPYWGLRDYGIEQIFGGNGDCEHEWIGQKRLIAVGSSDKSTLRDGKGRKSTEKYVADNRNIKTDICSKCYAWKGQLGLEPTPEMYIEHLTEIFNEVKRVLKKEGTLWLNMGDTYSNSGGCGWTGLESKNWKQKAQPHHLKSLPPKCLCMIPERLSWSLIQNGWILRNKIIWFKPNSMPSSVKDRFSNRWEYIFYFVKSRKNYFDLDSAREPLKKDVSIERMKRGISENHKYAKLPLYGGGGGLNKPRRNIKFNYRVRDSEKKKLLCPQFKATKTEIEKYKRKGVSIPGQEAQGIHRKRHSGYFGANGEYLVNPKGKNPGDIWIIPTQPFKGAHYAVFPEELCRKAILPGSPNGGIVLDPFAGTGTVGFVARKLGRNFILIDTKEEFCKMAEKRLAQGVL